MLRPRKVLRWSLIGVAALIGMVVAAPVIVSLLQISISAAPWRGRIAHAITQALGREVTLQGPLELIPSLRPSVRVGGIRVANPPGFSTTEFASLGAARLRIELLPLLHDEIRVVDVSAEDVRLRLEQTADGRANWVFNLPAAPAPAAQPVPSASSDAGVRLEAISRIAFQRINLEYFSGGRRRYFALDELVGEGRLGQPVALTLRGTVEKSFPYTVTVNAAPLTDLYARDKPWPLELNLEFAGTALHAAGSVKDPLGNPAAELTFGLGTGDLAELELLLQTTLPAVGATGMSGRVHWADGRLNISSLRGVMGESSLEGELALDLTGAKPRVSGDLILPVLDLRPFLSSNTPPPSPSGPASTQSDPLKTLAELEKQKQSLKELGLMDADLTLKVDRWLGVPGDVRDAQLRVVLQDGALKAPVQVTLADVAVAGELDVDSRAEVPDFLLWLGTERSKLGRLAEVFARVRGVQGDLGHLRLQLKGRGDTLRTIVRALDVRLDLAQGRLSYGNVEGGKPVDFRLDTLQIAIPPGGRLTGRVRGALLGEAFAADFKGGDLPTLMQEVRWPLELDASASGAVVHIDGVLAEPEAQEGIDLRFSLGASRAGDVGRWLGLSRNARAPLSMAGHVRMVRDEWRLSAFVLTLGRTALTAELARVGVARGQPLVQAQLAIQNLDVQELEAMLPPPDPNAPKTAMIDLPILPKGIDLFDANVDVQVKRIEVQPAPVTDVSFSGRIREGRMWPSPFSAKTAGAVFSGAIGVDLRGEVPEASVWVAAEKVDVGALLQQLKLVQDLEARVELLRVELVGRGSRLGEMLERSSLLAELESGQLTLRDPNKTLQLPIQVTKGIARVAPGKPLTVDLDGAIDVTPVTIRIVGAELSTLLKFGSRIPFSVAAEAAGTRLELKGQVALPVSQRDMELDLSVYGERFNSLNGLARVELPPWGPWKLGGQFRVSKDGYEVPGLSLRVGESTLNGNGRLITTGQRPRLELQLAAPRVQLDDFKLTGWSLVEKKDKKDAKPLSVEEMRAKAKEAAAQGQKLLSPEVLRALDADLNVAVDEVLSGQDKLGSGTLHARLADGRFTLDPAEVNTAGGSTHITLAYQPSATDVEVKASIRADRFDYGILARRIKPDTDLQGLFSLQMDIEARAPTLDTLMQHANGRIDFAVWPHNFKAGIFDLWAVNLLVALVPAVDPSSESKVNCAIARFDLRDGKLTHKEIVMDTSRMRVSGEGKVDFDTEVLAFRLVPTAKTPQFFSLSTPVGVTGTITNFHVGVSGSDVLETTARLFTSVIVVPLQSLMGRRLPRDGADVCGSALR